jgi:hypothetical protein
VLFAAVPWHVPPAEDLACEADLVRVDERTVAIVPHPSPALPATLSEPERVTQGSGPVSTGRDRPTTQPETRFCQHLVFAADGRLAERRLVELPASKVLARATYSADGEVVLIDGDGKELKRWKLAVKPVEAPELNPDAARLVILPMPAPKMRSYPPETMVAEKLQTMIYLGAVNSRMKDFYDLWILANRFEFKGDVLQEAVRRTFEHRNTDIPTGEPAAFSAQFAREKQSQWRAFLTTSALTDTPDQ